MDESMIDPTRPLSDLLEHKFGSLLLTVLSQSDTERVITLSTAQNQVLEHSIVGFLEPGMAAYPDVHQQILDGAMIGKAFVAAGVPYYRDTVSMQSVALSPDLRELFDAEAAGVGTQIEVIVRVGPDRLPYAHIIETYSPAAGII